MTSPPGCPYRCWCHCNGISHSLGSGTSCCIDGRGVLFRLVSVCGAGGGLPKRPSTFAGWYFRVYALVWPFRRKLCTFNSMHLLEAWSPLTGIGRLASLG